MSRALPPTAADADHALDLPEELVDLPWEDDWRGGPREDENTEAA